MIDLLWYFIAVFQALAEWLWREFWMGLPIRILQKGRIPRHMAFIMDGNRRYARRAGLARRSEGHLHGFQRFEKILKWCLDLGVQTVTVYAFSIENFKRPREEVDLLMALAKEKLESLAQNHDLIERYKVGIRVIGALDLLPADVRQAACEAMLATRHNDQHQLNICMPYTSSQELFATTNYLHRAVQHGHLETHHITAENMRQMIEMVHGGTPDVLVRTSGERRLSDFLVWQAVQRPGLMLVFLDALWPELGWPHFVWIILQYQLRPPCTAKRPQLEDDARWRRFLGRYEEDYWRDIRQMSRPVHKAEQASAVPCPVMRETEIWAT